MIEEPLPLLIIVLVCVLFPIAFCGFWVLVLWILSHVGGWATLAARHRESGECAPYGIVMQSGRLGLVNYNGVLKIEPTDSGLRLGILPLFGAFHPPLLIPWEEIRGLEFKTFFFSKRARVLIGSGRVVKLDLPEKVLKPWQDRCA